MVSKSTRLGGVLLAGFVILGLGATGVLSASAARASEDSRPCGVSHRSASPLVRGAPCDDRGGGGQPDPLSLYNQHVELADGELYLLKGQILMAPALLGTAHKLQPYFSVDLDAQPWLSGKLRQKSPLYMIEGALSSWRPLDGTYGELAAIAHVRLYVTQSGSPVQIITLEPVSGSNYLAFFRIEN